MIHGIIGPEESLDLFEKAMKEWSVGNSEKAYGYMKLAIEGEVYVTDLPEYWFMIAKLEMELGKVEEAKEALSNVLILKPNREEVLNILDTMDSLMHGLPAKNTITHMDEFDRIGGFINGVEYFYTPLDVDMRGNEVIVLDRVNRRLVMHGEKKFRVLKLEGDPRSILYDPNLDRIYYSDVANGNVLFINPEDGNTELLCSGLHYPVIFDIDRAGRILVGDMFDDALYLISHDGIVQWKYDLMKDGRISIFNDAKILFEKVYVQDLSNRMYRIIDLLSGKETEKLKFPYDDLLPLSFDVDGYGGLIVLWNDGKLRYMDKTGKIDELKINGKDFKHFSKVRYKPPFLLLVEPFDHSVAIFITEREKPEYIGIITSVDLGLNEINLEFTINTFTGRCVTNVKSFLTVYDSGGRVTFTYKRKRVESKIYETNELMDFLMNDLKKLNRRIKNYVLVHQRSNDVSEDLLKYLLPVKMKNVTFYLLKTKELRITKNLEDFIHMSSGMVIDENQVGTIRDYLKKSKYCMDEITYPVSFSMRSIKPVTMRFKIFSHSYFDTIYYIGGFKLEKGEEGKE